MEREVLYRLVFLTQTDTTVGFVSRNKKQLTHIKKRPPHKHYIKALNSLETLKRFTRVPSVHRNRIRRAKRTTFIMPDGHSYRVIKDKHHLLLLDRLKWAYTTSANLSGHIYNEAFAIEAADVIVRPLHNEKHPSTILKLGKTQQRRIR